MQQVSKDNSKNEMILHFLDELENLKADFSRYEYDFCEKRPDQITTEFRMKYGMAIAKSKTLDSPLNP